MARNDTEAKTPLAPIIVGVAVIFIMGIFIGTRLGGHNNKALTPSSAKAQQSQDKLSTFDATPAGAVQSATTFLNAYPGLSRLPKDEREAQLVQFLAPNATQAQRDDMSTSLDNAAGKFTSLGVVRTAPLGYKVTAQDSDTVSLRVWTVSVFADDGSGISFSAWALNDMTMVRTLGKWRVLSWTPQTGPSPADLGTLLSIPKTDPATAAQLRSTIEELGAFEHVPAS